MQGASARMCGSVGTCQSLAGAFFAIRAKHLQLKIVANVSVCGIIKGGKE